MSIVSGRQIAGYGKTVSALARGSVAAAVALLSSHLSPFGIFGMIFGIASILGVLLIWLGRSIFGYTTWLPTIPVKEALT